jgi:hypothetical protein
LARCGPGAITDPCAPDQLHKPASAIGGTTFIAIKYAECLSRPVRSIPAGCACEDEACEYSRVRDSFQIECLDALPPSHEPTPGPSLCELIELKQLPVCPPCPAEPWVVLAHITLPASPSDRIADNHIDNFGFRRQVFSTAVLQEQLIDCCCGPEAQEPARVIRVEPPDGSEHFLIEGQPTPGNFPTSVVLAFSKNVRADTVNTSTIQLTLSEGDRPPVPVSGNVTYDEGSRAARFAPDEGFRGSANGNRYRISARGDGQNPIIDVDDFALDGDADGNAGGTFASEFTVFFVVG